MLGQNNPNNCVNNLCSLYLTELDKRIIYLWLFNLSWATLHNIKNHN